MHCKVLITVALLISVSAALPVLNIWWDASFPVVVQTRLLQLLSKANHNQFNITTGEVKDITNLPAGSMIITLGNTALGKEIIPPENVNKLPPEGFIVATKVINGVTVVAGNGVAPSRDLNPLLPPNPQNNGLLYATYAILEYLGFGFLHPLDTVIPPALQLPPQEGWNVQQSPRWPVRGWHHHTEHPLEYTLLLQGWGPNGPDDLEGWTNMLQEFHALMEWHVANRVNAFQFVLLWATSWQKFAEGSERQARYKQLCEIAEQWGVAMGVDQPIAMLQQHGWHMVNPLSPYTEQLKQIEKRIDWLHDAGFHFISTESGFSEFTPLNCSVMLGWMNHAAQYARTKYNMKVTIKVHISSAQVCNDFEDPVTRKKPCNFNYLPHHALPELGVLPHTVQLYTFDDPAPTYGQTNFSSMFEFMFVEAQWKRFTLYFGETAYWVNYDVDVPLFLPIYGAARLYDLRKIAKREEALGVKINGQVNFESGWEWAYWLSNTITARAAWNPALDKGSNNEAFAELLKQFTRHFSDNDAELWTKWFIDVLDVQHDLLVLGLVNGTAPPTIEKLNGIAYLEGWDTWAVLGALYSKDVLTQPNAYSIDEMIYSLDQKFYPQHLRPLLLEMSQRFNELNARLKVLSASAPPHMRNLVADIVDSMNVTTLRADFILAVYDYLWRDNPLEWRNKRIHEAVAHLESVKQVVKQRESQYRVPVERIAGWYYNPTAYSYGYVWTAHSQYYYYRDLWRALQPTFEAMGPCFMNKINPIDVALGEGYIQDFTDLLKQWLEARGILFVSECLRAPKQEPIYFIPPLPHSN